MDFTRLPDVCTELVGGGCGPHRRHSRNKPMVLRLEMICYADHLPEPELAECPALRASARTSSRPRVVAIGRTARARIWGLHQPIALAHSATEPWWASPPKIAGLGPYD